MVSKLQKSCRNRLRATAIQLMDKWKHESLREIVTELCNLEYGLTDWEMNFVNDLYDKPTRVWSLKEIAKVQQIHKDTIG